MSEQSAIEKLLQTITEHELAFGVSSRGYKPEIYKSEVDAASAEYASLRERIAQLEKENGVLKDYFVEDIASDNEQSARVRVLTEALEKAWRIVFGAMREIASITKDGNKDYRFAKNALIELEVLARDINATTSEVKEEEDDNKKD